MQSDEYECDDVFFKPEIAIHGGVAAGVMQLAGSPQTAHAAEHAHPQPSLVEIIRDFGAEGIQQPTIPRLFSAARRAGCALQCPKASHVGFRDQDHHSGLK